MSTRTVLIIALALVFGGSAAIGINTLRTPPEGPQAEGVPVVVTTKDVGRFTVLKPDALELRRYPKEQVPPGALTSIEEAVDRVVHFPLAKNETVLDSRLSPRGSGRGIATAIPRGMRAFTIQTN